MFDQFVDAFLLHRESEGRSLKTLEWHRGALRLFKQWLEQNAHPLHPEQWDATLIRRYFVSLRERPSSKGTPLTPYTVRNYASSVLAFCLWLYQEDLIPKNIIERVSAPKTPLLVKEPFEAVELKRLIHAAKADKRCGLRDHAILLFMLDTGCRASEVCSMKADDILWSQRLAKVYGKGSKERVVFFSAETMKAMQRYNLRSKTECACFFKTEEGRELTASGLLHIMKRLGQKANVADCHPHRFRHTFAISFLRSGGNVLALQRILGHTTLAMTQRYVAMVSDDLQREHVQHSPVNYLLK